MTRAVISHNRFHERSRSVSADDRARARERIRQKHQKSLWSASAVDSLFAKYDTSARGTLPQEILPDVLRTVAGSTREMEPDDLDMLMRRSQQGNIEYVRQHLSFYTISDLR